MKELLEKLCLLDGISGDEGAVRDFIISQIKDHSQITVDPLGNVIAFCKGKKTPKNKVLVSAHMDEVGMIVTYINSDGTLKVECVGGVDPAVVYAKRVRVGKNKVTGVIASTAVHNLSKEEKGKTPGFDKLTVDIGCESREQAQKLVSLGDSVCFDSRFLTFGDGFVKCKAIDDRAGCAIMIKLIQDTPEYDTYFTFVVQEEVGLRGATAASYTVDADYAFVLEATTAADIPSAQADKKVCCVGDGPVVSFMDRHTIYDKEMFDLAFETAKENHIPCQTKTMIAGGNDAGAIHVSRCGVRTTAISLPCRYLHSPSCVIKLSDMQDAYRLTKLILDRTYNR
ncbi:M42 family peptidase [Ruminococcus sp. FC2018]|uniref:M42 family metallopeptidase n=1 Tax=Ruminococcus sp. FC2018 TaxID=1410617 RepID=UPI00048D1D6C|nr:M42 family peptidase [Ruminococcus sp. FC2018]